MTGDSEVKMTASGSFEKIRFNGLRKCMVPKLELRTRPHSHFDRLLLGVFIKRTFRFSYFKPGESRIFWRSGYTADSMKTLSSLSSECFPDCETKSIRFESLNGLLLDPVILNDSFYMSHKL